MPPLPLTFIQSASAVSQLPSSAAEVTVVGRSNVGKSSLLNALANRKRLAHVSNTPGRTRLLNLFEIADQKRGSQSGGQGSTLSKSIVDLPGYGFAKAPANMRATWQTMIEGYLLERKNLLMVMVLVDGVVGPTQLDSQMLDWLRDQQLPHSVVATKHDKVKSSKRESRKRALAEGCSMDVGDVIWVSAEKGTGVDRLRGLVLRWLDG